MTIVAQPSTTDEKGGVAVLPTSAGWVHQWQSFWGEIWVSTANSVLSVSEVVVDLQYSTEYLTAEVIEHGPAFTEQLGGVIDDDLGRISAIGGGTLVNGLARDGHVLLARVRFTANDDLVPVNEANRNIGPHDPQMALADGQSRLAGGMHVMTALDEPRGAQLWAAIYDIDDNDQIDFGDLSYFAAAFGRTVGEPTVEPPFVWWADFDKSGRVDFGDLAFFAPNFNKSRSGVQAGTQTLVFPPNFPDAWPTGAGGGEGQADNGGDSSYHVWLADAGRESSPKINDCGNYSSHRVWLADAGRESPPEGTSPPAATTVRHADRGLAYGRADIDRLDRWELLDDILTLLADRPSNRLPNDPLPLHDALFAQFAR